MRHRRNVAVMVGLGMLAGLVARGDDGSDIERRQNVSPGAVIRARVPPAKTNLRMFRILEQPIEAASPFETEPAPEPLDLHLPSPDSITPTPPAGIPDDPPPHEGAMIDVPIVVEPPDLLLVEVLESLPGRPITGERLVRPDGNISLGFYGEVHVRGLTVGQIKEKVILHLRRFLADETLGLVEMDFETGKPRPVAPRDSNRVFVDVTAYNSKFFIVQGEVAAPGRIPVTGHETVLDALNYAGGLLNSADAKNLTLFRPAQGDRPQKNYPIDLAAIRNGERARNYQLFPGDRLIVGRDATVDSTVAQERQVSNLHTHLAALNQLASTLRDLQSLTPTLPPDERTALIREWLNLWWQANPNPGGPTSNQDLLRRLLLPPLKAKASDQPVKDAPK